MKKRILAGITKENDLYFLEVEDRSEGHDYFAMSGFTVTPILMDDAKLRVEEYLYGGDAWKDAVREGLTELSKDDWVQYILNTDGELSGFDNSLFSETITVDGKDYVFESGSCGQHQEKSLKHYFIDEQIFRNLIRAWDKYHLKPVFMYEVSVSGNAGTIGYMIEGIGAQNFHGLAMQAITIIKQ